MLLSLLVTAMLAGQPQTTAGTVPAKGQAPTGQAPTHTEATELARNGQREAALDAFRRIAGANPRDHQARVAIGRLQMELGDPERAESVFRSVLLEDPSNLDATIGLGFALNQLRRSDEAVEVLERAEQTAPEHSALLVALGESHREAGHTTRSLTYLRRAVAAAPTRENREALERTLMIHGHRVQSDSFFESYDVDVPDTRATGLTVNARLSDSFRVLGRGQVQRKFGVTEQRGGVGVEWRWKPETTIASHVLIGGDDVLPEVDVNLGVGHDAGAAEWSVGARYIEFSLADVVVISPAVTWSVSDRMSLGLRYALSATDFHLMSEGQDTHSAKVQGSYLVYPRVWLNLAYARGIEDFDTLSPDRIGEFDADTVSGGVRFDLPTLTSIVGTYEYQWRPNDTEMNRFSVSLVQRF